MMPRHKLVAVFHGPPPVVDSAIVGEWHHWAPDDRPHHFVVCYPPDWDRAVAWLEARGAACLPHPWDHDGLSPGTAAVLGHGTRSGDTHFRAGRKLAAAVRWPPLDPTRG